MTAEIVHELRIREILLAECRELTQQLRAAIAASQAARDEAIARFRLSYSGRASATR